MEESHQRATIAPSDLVDHLFSLAKLLQGAQSGDVVHFNTPSAKTTCSDFINDPSGTTLFVSKLSDNKGWIITSHLDEQHENEPHEHEHQNDDVATPIATIVIIKDKGLIYTEDETGSWEKQLQVVNIPHSGSSFDTLRSLISFGVGTYFDAITSQNRTEVVASTKKKINELALSLQHLEQMIQIPDLMSSLHPVIQEAVSKGATLDNYLEYIPEETLTDSTFLNSVQTTVNEWVRSIQSVTKMERDVSDGSALDEATFWISMESSLNAIQQQLDSQGVQLALEVLKYAKRYHATVSFMSDIGIKDAITKTADYNKLMRDIPLNDLMAAESFTKIEEAIVLIMNHLKKLRVSTYPVNRALPFVEAISADLESKLKPMLLDIMSLEFDEFKRQISQCNVVFDTWDRQVKEFTNLARELLRKRGEKFIFVKVNSKTTYIKERLDDALEFRSRHENFVSTINNIDMSQEDLEHAYDAVRVIELLDHEKHWNAAKRSYDKRIQQIENYIVEELRSKLDSTSNFNEMFQIFEQHNTLLERPRIRSAVQEYQSHLLSVVKDEIAHLQQSFGNKNEFDTLGPLRDYPAVAFSLIWAKQSEDKLMYLLERIELVLGKEWSSYAEGQKIYAESMVFKRKLNSQSLYDAWLISAADKTISGKILEVVKGKTTSSLRVNFDDSLLSFFKEVRALCWQNFNVPHSIMVNSRQVRKVYPHAIILRESLQTLTSVATTIQSLEEVSVLVDGEMEEIYRLITVCLEIDWESLSRSQDLDVADVEITEHNQLSLVVDLENSIDDLFNKCQTLISYHQDITSCFDLLLSCEFGTTSFSASIIELQLLIDTVSTAGYSNVGALVDILNTRLISTLVTRYCSTSINAVTYDHILEAGSSVTLNPLLEASKAKLYELAQDHVNVLLQQKRLVEKTLHTTTESFKFDFSDHMDIITEHMESVLIAIETDFANALEFVSSWYQFQALWDVNSEYIYNDFDLNRWFELFEEIKKTRILFDNPEVTRSFGCFVINFDRARVQISSKFNLWNRDVLLKFSEFVGDATKSTHESITKARKSLESAELNLASVQDTIEVITNVQKQKNHSAELKVVIGQLRTAERILLKQRFSVPPYYIYVDQLDNDFESLMEVILRRTRSLDHHAEAIKKNIETECKRMEHAIADAQNNWHSSRPVDDLTTPSKAISILSAIEKSLTALDVRRNLLVDAASMLALPVTVSGDLSGTIQELTDLKSVWISIQGLWGSLEDMRKLKWSSVKPRALRKDLEDLMADTRSMPVRVRQYHPFQYFLKTVTDLSNSQKMLVSLKEDFVKERHLKSLFKTLGKKYSDALTVGDIWSLDLLMNQTVVKTVIDQANSERTIEEALQSIRETWDEQGFVFFDFNSKSLVKNFPQLLELASNGIASLNSMKNSPVFKVFEKDVLQWESTLSVVYQILDVWLEAQRKWIDLDGVFDAKSGVRKLLPHEYSRFHSVSTEYQNTLKKIYRSSLVTDISSIGDLHPTMERLSESLDRIAAALSDYLEQQRTLSPRLYLLNNEDLIDLIANKENADKHMKKMFSGVHSVGYDASGLYITHVTSLDGECLMLGTAVSLEKYQRLDEWLNQLDYEIKVTLSHLACEAISSLSDLSFSEWVVKYPSQILILALQIEWTTRTEKCISQGGFDVQLSDIEHSLSSIGSSTLINKKLRESLIIELVHQKDVVVELIDSIKTGADFSWLKQQRFYLDMESTDPLSKIVVRVATKQYLYGFEYLGTIDRLVYTPLLNSCFVAMAGALDQRLGGSLFGPAGTGKTESIKQYANSMAIPVISTNMDEGYDFKAITRLFCGIAQMNAWLILDEFNRLEPHLLSAVSAQLENIELSLKLKRKSVKLLDRPTPIGDRCAFFVTMNPDYAGRTALPDNLKKLFRSFSMQKPDTQVIAEVLLRARGFESSETAAKSVNQTFQTLKEKCTEQSHYDFSLRAIKSTLEHASKIRNRTPTTSTTQIIVKALNEMVLPRLVAADVQLFHTIVEDIFFEVDPLDDDTILRNSLVEVSKLEGYVPSDNFLLKAEQLYHVLLTNQGVMLVGKSGSGKTVIWKMLLQAMSKVLGAEYVHVTIDPKVKSKNELFGYLDPITREWTDGVFTGLIRRLDSRAEYRKHTYIVFDGDIDPLWVESLNSVLDDNKVLTLPNGERLAIPETVRLLFEVDNLDHATPATVSRCGMVWVEDGIVSLSDILNHELHIFEHKPWTDDSTLLESIPEITTTIKDALPTSFLNGLVSFCATQLHPVMQQTELSLIRNFMTLLKSSLSTLANRRPTTVFVLRAILLSLIWAFSGSCNLVERSMFSTKILEISPLFHDLIPADMSNVLDFDLDVEYGWRDLSTFVQDLSLETHQVTNTSTVIPTIDTYRHEQLVYSILQQKKSLILCGPPGSGKTMTLYAALERAPEIELSNLNFSKETEPEVVLRAIEQLCEYRRTSDGWVLHPKSAGKRVVIFADEINLPRKDEYGTQRVISFLRQLIEQNGFWRSSDRQWVQTQDIQFVGACNKPGDAGRVKLSDRFLSHVLVIMVDYPGRASIQKIYSTYNYTLLKVVQLSTYAEELTSAMIQVYMSSKEHFPGSIYSPRELTRWVRGLYTALRPMDSLSIGDMVRLWAHEAQRIFSDRIADDTGREWTWNLIYNTAASFFPTTDLAVSLTRPLLYSDWLSLNYEPVNVQSLSLFLQERALLFADEVLDIDFTLYDEAIDHILRIDRVLKQPQGHMILVGPSGSGKTTLAKFVSWINGLTIHQLGVHRKYTLSEFDDTLKDLLKRCGIQDEKICLIVDESTVLDGSFLERMNSLLANSQIRDLFEDDFTTLLGSIKEAVNSRGLLLDSTEELYEWFTNQIASNLHVVFTISDPTRSNAPQLIASPALINRCVLNHIQWSSNSVAQVSRKMLLTVPLDRQDYRKPEDYNGSIQVDLTQFREVIVDAIAYIHSMTESSSPVNLISTFIDTYYSQNADLKKHQNHVDVGLITLRQTVNNVKNMNKSLEEKQNMLVTLNVNAQGTLQTLLQRQKECEDKTLASVEIQNDLENTQRIIEERRAVVMRDLALAEPAVLEARRGVQNIKKQHLTELRSMSTPPATVQMVLESVCVLLGYDVRNWKDVQKIIRKDDFVIDILQFDGELNPELREFMESTYLSRPEYNFQSADRASRACGPLLQWVEAQVKYSIVLDRIDPLRAEVEALEEDSMLTKARLDASDDLIQELTEKIQLYKDEYSELIRDIENIKSQMATVEAKAGRAMTLVESLTQERTRWAKTIQSFDEQYEALPGNSLLASAMVTYAGSYDTKKRQHFINTCASYLRKAGVKFDEQFRFAGFLNSPSNLLSWESHGLSNDEHFFENVTIIENTKRVPLIIDPFGQILDALSSKIAPQKMTITSFLDDGFVKTLENALRFGGLLVIQDAEYFDPIISPILNGDVQILGSRKVIKIKNKEIDLAKNLSIYLHTRDSGINPSPFVATRTTIVDFTVTTSSLEVQSLNLALASERPDLEKQRLDLIKLDTDYKVKLRSLEDSLLTSLSESEGDLLENNQLLSSLEVLKRESLVVEEKINETATVMARIDEVIAQYQPFARGSMLIFSVIDGLRALSGFYQFSLSSYMGYLQTVLSKPSKRTLSQSERVEDLVISLYREVFAQVSMSLKNSDKMVFAVALSLIYLKEKDGDLFVKFVLSLLQDHKNDERSSILRDAFAVLSIQIPSSSLDQLLDGDMSAWKTIGVDLEDLDRFLSSYLTSANIGDHLAALSDFLSSGSGSFSSKYSFDDVVAKSDHRPIVLGSVAGCDASFMVRSSSELLGKDLRVISLGSIEATDIASRELDIRSKSGGWLLIQNIQTAPIWLEYLEKRLQGLPSNPEFKLFLTCEVDSNIPSTLLRYCHLLVFENSPGIKTIMKEYFKVLSDKFQNVKPVEKSRIYFMLCWYHAIVQERSRFVPVGFAKNYDFNDSDFEGATFLIDRWFEEVSGGRVNVSPDLIDWSAIQYFVGEIVYGGKASVASDAEYLKSLAQKLFCVDIFSHTFNMIDNEVSSAEGSVLHPPEGTEHSAFEQWIMNLPDLQPSCWIGLDNEVVVDLMGHRNREVIKSASGLYEDVI